MLGKTIDYKDIAALSQQEKQPIGKLHSQDFTCTELGLSVYLLCYRSAWISPDGMASRFAKRASIWVLSDNSWKIQYHQGTPCDAFDLDYNSCE